MSSTPHVSPASLSLTAPSPSFSEQSAFNLSAVAPHLPHLRPHQLTTASYSPLAETGPTAAAPSATAAAVSKPPELELSPISKGFVGKGPRSRPNSARPQALSAASELPQGSDGQLEVGGSGVQGQPSGGAPHSSASLTHPSSGNANSSGGQGLASPSGDGGSRGTTNELSARLSGGGRSNNSGEGQGLMRRRSRSLSLSREQGEGGDLPPQRQQGAGRTTPEPEVQQASTAAEGDLYKLYIQGALTAHQGSQTVTVTVHMLFVKLRYHCHTTATPFAVPAV